MDFQKFHDLFLTSLHSLPPRLLPEPFQGAAEEAAISFYADLCPLQDALRYRARRIGMRIAHWLIDEKGELDRKRLERLNAFLKEGFYWIAPRREADALIYGHLRKALRFLEESPELEVLLKKFSPPLCHKKAEAIIRDTLWLPFDSDDAPSRLQSAQIRRAVLGTWLTLLRQATGSCFATAPAILIQQNHPLRLLKDLYELLSTGRLKRVIGGTEYIVPLNLSAATADLQKPLSGFSSIEQLAFSPGLVAAFEAGGILDPQQPFLGNIETLRQLLHQKLEEIPLNAETNAETLIRTLLLQSIGLEESDLEEEAYLSRIQMTPLLAKQSAVYYQKPSERAQKVSDFKRRFRKACAAFQAFAECALLRSWEYTIASFCDVKVDFARWNLYIGLGLHPDQPGGIGSFLYRFIDGHLQKWNQEAMRLQEEYERAVNAARSAQAIVSTSVSDAHRNQLRMELVSAVQYANSVLDMRDKAAEKAQALVEFFSSLMKQYDEKLQEYFQESFDPSLVADEAHLFDDSQAGFRLVYKQGRADASLWISIDSGETYIDSLRDFFSSIERDLILPPQIDFSFVSEMTTSLIQFIQEPEFLTAAIARSKEKGRNSPWDYFSGGTMETLLQNYCSREQPLKETAIVPHSEQELLAFLLSEKRKGPLLMRSPTHAFIFYPELLKKGTSQRHPIQHWDEGMQEHLSHLLSERLPPQEKALFLHLFRQKSQAPTPETFRLHLIDSLQTIKDSRIKNRVALVDSVLFENTPLVETNEAKERVVRILAQAASLTKQHLDPLMKHWEGSYKGPYEIHQMALSLILETTRSPISHVDWEMHLADTMRNLGYCGPSPQLFADTNWSGWFFGFIQNPATGYLELWRLNRTALQGFPMSDWKEWLNQDNTAGWFVLDPGSLFE